VGHLQVVTRLSDQLYRNAWSVLGESWEGVRDLIIPVGIALSKSDITRAETRFGLSRETDESL